MNGFNQAQRQYDRELPTDSAAYFRADELAAHKETYREPQQRARVIAPTNEQVEQFIADLVAAADKDIFLENKVGTHARAASNELALHMAVADQWVHDKEAVGSTIGRVFWVWAKQATTVSLR